MPFRATALAFRLRAWLRVARGPRTRNDSAIAIVLGIALFAVAGSVRSALLLRPEAAPLLVPAVALGLVTGSIVMTVLPLVPLFPRFSANARPEWPLTGLARASLDLLAATTGIWALGFLFVGASLLRWGGFSSSAAAAVALAGALLGTAGLLLSVQLLLELARARRWSRVVAVAALAALFVALRAVDPGLLVRLLAPVDVLVRLASGEPWGLPFALCLAFAASPLALGARLHWRWSESRGAGASATKGSAALVRWALGTRLLPGLTPASRAVAAQSLAYLSRAGRYWFFALYVLVGAAFIAKRLAAGFSPEARVTAVFLWGAAGSGAFYFNLFAFEGRALPRLLASPASGRDLLLGKHVSLFAGSAVYLAAAAVVALLRPGPGAGMVVSAALLAVSFVLLVALFGAAASIRFVHPVGLHESFRGFLSPPVMAISLAGMGAATAATSGVFLAARSLAGTLAAPWLFPASAGALFLLALALYRPGLARLGALLDARREALALDPEGMP